MENLTKFRNRIFLTAGIIAVIAEIISLFILGIDFIFAAGLLIGTVVAVVNFFIMSICTEISLEKKKPLVTIIGTLLRYVLYGISFTPTLLYSYKMGIACGMGFFTIQISIMFLFVILPSLKRMR